MRLLMSESDLWMGCIDKNDLSFGRSEHALDGGSSRLRLMGSNGKLLTDQGIEQR